MTNLISLLALLEFYEKNGQGADIYLPLIGTGLSKSGLSRRESLALIEQTAGASDLYLSGKMTVVVSHKDVVDLGFNRNEV